MSTPTQDPVSLIGAGFLGAFGAWAFARMRRLARPRRNGDNSEVLAELHQIKRRLGTIEGTLRGMGVDLPDAISGGD